MKPYFARVAWPRTPTTRSSRRWRHSKLSAENKASSPDFVEPDERAAGAERSRVSVAPVANKRDLNAFIKLPWRLYKGERNWVPPLLRLQAELFSVRKNAFFKHADVQLMLAHKDGRVAGRISAHIDHEHNRYWNERTGFFGFFESEDDPEVTTALLSAAEEWLRARGMDRIRGPMNFSTNGEVGFLVEGHDSRPVVMMPFTHAYYLGLMEGAGYQKAKDLFAWRWSREPVPEGPARMVKELRSRPEISVRRPNMKRFGEEVRIILDLYNDAWSENWGFVPATDAEAEDMVRDLKFLVDPEIVPFVEVNGIPAGVGLAIPNLNEAIYDLNGRLFPFGWIKLLWRLKVRGVRSGRLALMGIRKEFRSRQYAGLAYLVCDEFYRSGFPRFDWAELSWTLEDNGLVNSLIRKVGAEHYKTYRVYEKTLIL